VDIDAAIIICRLRRYAATISIFGASGFLWVLAPAELADELGRRLRIPLVAAGCAATATTFAWLLLEVGDIGDNWTDAVALAPRAGAKHYDSRSELAFTSSLRCCTISVVLRISGSLRAMPMVDAIERSRALSLR
jgi:hypothetical protein